MKLKELVKKLNTNYYNLLFTGNDYPEPLDIQDVRENISRYIEKNFSRLAVNDWFIEDEYDIADYHAVVKNELFVNAWNIGKKYEITQAEFNPVENYDKYSEITNDYGVDKNTTSYGVDKSTTNNGASQTTSVDSVTGFDSGTFKDNTKNVTDTAAITDSTTRDAHIDSMTRDAHIDIMTEHTHGNIGTMRADDMLKGVWTLADLNFYQYVSELVVNSICMSIFECEV